MHLRKWLVIVNPSKGDVDVMAGTRERRSTPKNAQNCLLRMSMITSTLLRRLPIGPISQRLWHRPQGPDYLQATTMSPCHIIRHAMDREFFAIAEEPERSQKNENSNDRETPLW